MEKNKFYIYAVLGLFLVMHLFTYQVNGQDVFTEEEEKWLRQERDQEFHVGFAPYEGSDLFIYQGSEYGYLRPVLDIFEEETGLTFVLDKDKDWSQAYEGLFSQEVDLLFGANATEERLKVMAFTRAIKKYPYIVLGSKEKIKAIGDLDGDMVGFIEGDMIIDIFNENYKNISLSVYEYSDPNDLFQAIEGGHIIGGITAKTEIVDEKFFDYKSVSKVAELRDLSSDMTFSTLIENQILASILEKVIAGRQDDIEKVIQDAGEVYMHKTLKFSEEESQWFQRHPVIRVGVATDYLPIDYYGAMGQYEGVAGSYFTSFANLIGLEIEAVPGTFDYLMDLMEAGKIDVLNMAKTEDRVEKYVFTNPFSEERDIIYGARTSVPVYDIYGLENLKVAVIEGFWHEELLLKNLRNPNIVITKDIEESLSLIQKGQADYLIENPTVADYYIEGLGFSGVTKKGETSTDSFLYFGMLEDHEPLVSIFNKSMRLLNYDEAKYLGVQGSPALKNIMNQRLMYITLVALLSLALVGLILVRVFRVMIRHRTEKEVLKEREILTYTDVLSGLYNRRYYTDLLKDLNSLAFPQAFVMMDLNRLKHVNDTYGHVIGDELIKAFGKVLLEVFHKQEAIRMGGDEFLVLIPGCDGGLLEDKIKDLENACSLVRIRVNDERWIEGISASFGYTIRKDQGIMPRTCIHDADLEMYKNKEKYRSSLEESHE